MIKILINEKLNYRKLKLTKNQINEKDLVGTFAIKPAATLAVKPAATSAGRSIRPIGQKALAFDRWAS